MESEHRKILQNNQVDNKDLSCTQLLDYLIQEDVLSIHMKDVVMSKQTRQEKVQALFDILSQRSPKAFAVFCDTLITEFPWLADHLTEDKSNDRIKDEQIFRDTLRYTANSMGKQDVKDFLFLVADHIMDKRALDDDVSGGLLDVFRLLEHEGVIGYGYTSLLWNAFSCMNLPKLTSQFEEYNADKSITSPDDTTLVLFQTAKQLGKHKTGELVYMFKDEINDKKQEDTMYENGDGLLLFSHLRKRYDDAKEFLKDLTRNLECIGMKKCAVLVKEQEETLPVHNPPSHSGFQECSVHNFVKHETPAVQNNVCATCVQQKPQKISNSKPFQAQLQASVRGISAYGRPVTQVNDALNHSPSSSSFSSLPSINYADARMQHKGTAPEKSGQYRKLGYDNLETIEEQRSSTPVGSSRETSMSVISDVSVNPLPVTQMPTNLGEQDQPIMTGMSSTEASGEGDHAQSDHNAMTQRQLSSCDGSGDQKQRISIAEENVHSDKCSHSDILIVGCEEDYEDIEKFETLLKTDKFIDPHTQHQVNIKTRVLGRDFVEVQQELERLDKGKSNCHIVMLYLTDQFCNDNLVKFQLNAAVTEMITNSAKNKNLSVKVVFHGNMPEQCSSSIRSLENFKIKLQQAANIEMDLDSWSYERISQLVKWHRQNCISFDDNVDDQGKKQTPPDSVFNYSTSNTKTKRKNEEHLLVLSSPLVQVPGSSSMPIDQHCSVTSIDQISQCIERIKLQPFETTGNASKANVDPQQSIADTLSRVLPYCDEATLLEIQKLNQKQANPHSYFLYRSIENNPLQDSNSSHLAAPENTSDHKVESLQEPFLSPGIGNNDDVTYNTTNVAAGCHADPNPSVIMSDKIDDCQYPLGSPGEHEKNHMDPQNSEKAVNWADGQSTASRIDLIPDNLNSSQIPIINDITILSTSHDTMSPNVTQRGQLVQRTISEETYQPQSTFFSMHPESPSDSKSKLFYILKKPDIDELLKNAEPLPKDGLFGCVYKTFKKFMGVTVAIKKEHNANVGQDMSARQYSREKEIADIKHPFILPIFAVCEDPCCIVYPYMGNLDLDTVLDERPEVLTWELRVRITRQVCEGLQHLHVKLEKKMALVHTDIKPGNILLDRNFNARLGDFGLNKEIPDGKSYLTKTSIAGTAGYSDPSVDVGDPYRPISDVFGIGVVMLRLLTQKPAYCEESRTKLWQSVRKSKKEYLSTGDIINMPSFLKQDVWKSPEFLKVYTDLMRRCLFNPCEVHKKRKESKHRIELSQLSESLKKDIMDKTLTKIRMYDPLNDVENHNRCVACLLNARIKDVPLVSEECDERCCMYCRYCLMNIYKSPAYCPFHGAAEPLIGNRYRYAIIVGGNPGPGDSDEKLFHRDAQLLKNIFIDPRIMGMREENIKFLTSEDGCKPKQRVGALMKAIEDLKTKMDNQKRNCSLIFYYSGHSCTDKISLTPDVPGTSPLESSAIMSELQKLSLSHLLLIFDCCQAGNHKVENIDWRLQNYSMSTRQWSSCRASNVSRFNMGKNSYFTTVLVNGMKSSTHGCKQLFSNEGANQPLEVCDTCSAFKIKCSATGLVSIDDVKEYVYRHFNKYRAEEIPTMKGEHMGNEKLAFFNEDKLDYLVEYKGIEYSSNGQNYDRLYMKTIPDKLDSFKDMVIKDINSNHCEVLDHDISHYQVRDGTKEITNAKVLKELCDSNGIPVVCLRQELQYLQYGEVLIKNRFERKQDIDDLLRTLSDDHSLAAFTVTASKQVGSYMFQAKEDVEDCLLPLTETKKIIVVEENKWFWNALKKVYEKSLKAKQSVKITVAEKFVHYQFEGNSELDKIYSSHPTS